MITLIKSRIDLAFQIDMPLRLFFENPTIADLSLEIVKQKATQEDEALLKQLLNDLENLSDDEARKLTN